MVEKIFLDILNMSYIGSIVILAILLIRIFLKKVPKKFSYLLWAVALVRLVMPFTFESVLSLIPVNTEPIPVNIGYAVKPQISTGIPIVDSPVNNSLPAPEAVASVNPIQLLILIGTLIWVTIMIMMVIHGILSYMKVKKLLVDAIWEEENVFRSSKIDTPFVMGIINPKIYLPDSVSEAEREYILFHEQTHIKRLDHTFRFISYLVLCIHWFNPLVWIAFFVSSKDMEMACDESVIIHMGDHVKKEYSQSLLNFTTRRVKLSMSPLAFGEGDTKGRIKNILNFKTPKFYLIIVVILVLFIISIGLLANPIKKISSPNFVGNNYRVQDILFNAPIYSFTYTVASAPVFSVTSDYQLYTKEGQSNDWDFIGGLYKVEHMKDELLSWIHFTELLDTKVLTLLDRTKNIYRVDTNNENDVFYLVLETEDDQILIFYGYASEEGTSIRWIFETVRLESLEISLSATELWEHRTEYVGNNSAVGNIANQLQYPDYLEYKGISLQTENKPFGVTVILSQKSDEDIVSIDENSKVLFEIDACILFSLVQNLEQIAFSIDEGSTKMKPMIYTRDWAHETIDVDLWEESADIESYRDLLLIIKERISYGSDSTIDANIVSEESLLDKAISDAIMDYHSQSWNDGGYAFESHINLAIETNENEDEIMVYALVLYNVIEKKENGINTLSGSHVPCRLTFKSTGNDTYKLMEYWVPRDGSYYATDIREVFPDEVENNAIDTQKYILLQIQSIYQQAVKVLNINTNDVIDNLLEQIMSSPKASSNPGDYIDAHRIEYRELTYYGDYTIAFIESSLEAGVTGLRRKIIEILYDEMTM